MIKAVEEVYLPLKFQAAIGGYSDFGKWNGHAALAVNGGSSPANVMEVAESAKIGGDDRERNCSANLCALCGSCESEWPLSGLKLIDRRFGDCCYKYVPLSDRNNPKTVTLVISQSWISYVRLR